MWTTLKNLLFGPSTSEDRTPDFGRFSDERLLELWGERADLTEAARTGLRAECERRGIGPGKPQQQKPASVVILEPPLAPFQGDVLKVQERLGILLRTTPGRWALVHLPLWDPTPVELPADVALDAIIVCNQDPRGW